MKNTVLSSAELNDISNKLPEWKFERESIKREWKFKNFVEAFGFITKVAILSESINHHPEWSNSYNSLTIILTTHDSGGITNMDIKLAELINSLC